MNNKRSGTIPFVFGLILGVLCTIYLPAYARPYLPEFLVGNETVVKGTVTTKEKRGDALLLTVSTPEGSLLAKFKNKSGEVNLLVNENDEIQLTMPKYMPFIDDPKIVRIVKVPQAVPPPDNAPAVSPASPAGKSVKEEKPQQQMKPPDRGGGAPRNGNKTLNNE